MTFYTPSEEDREKLKEPRGPVYEEEELTEELQNRDFSRLIAVGDRVSQDIAESDIEADLSIVDGSIQREKVGEEHFEDIKAERTFETENPAGEISEEAWKTVRKASALRCSAMIEVDGEEDLLAIPALLFAPEGALVVYGQPGEGAVLMEANEEKGGFVEDLVDLDKSEHLIVGGSWDIFHSGHRYILSTAVEKSQHLDVGVTSDEMLTEKIGTEEHDSFEERASNIRSFLRALGKDDYRIIEIDDIYGNAVEEGETLLVNPENRENAGKINGKRRENGKKELKVEVINKLEAADGEPISCSRIRREEIDSDGKLK